MTDFVNRVLRPENPDWIIRSPLTHDFYKYTMGDVILNNYPGVMVKFELINRHSHIPYAKIVREEDLCAQFDHAMTVRYNLTDHSYIRGMNVYGHNMFSEKFLAFLTEFRLPKYELRRVGDQYKLSFECAWEDVTWWEDTALTILNELFYRALMESMPRHELEVLFAGAKNKLYQNLVRIRERPHIKIANFGLRRRFSHLWEQYVHLMCRDVLGDQFTGTSTVWMAFNQGIIPIGTNAHELPMVLTALADTDEEKRMAQYTVLQKWQDHFPMGGLRIVLPDTYGSRQFYNGMPKDLAEEVAHTWRGQRQDSGDPIEESLMFVKWLKSHGVDPLKEEKVSILSDGLDIDLILKIDDALEGVINHPFGWGTKLTNGFEGCHPRGGELAVIRGEQLNLTNDQLFRGHSIVCKTVSANGRPCVKLSNNPNKATGPKDEIERYMKIFGEEGRVSQEVFV